MNGYLIQRTYESNSNIEDALVPLKKIDDIDYYKNENAIRIIEDNVLLQQQGSWFGLGVKHISLSMLWPVVLTVFYLAILFYIEKKRLNINYLNKNYPEFDITALQLSPYSFEIVSSCSVVILLRHSGYFVFVWRNVGRLEIMRLICGNSPAP